LIVVIGAIVGFIAGKYVKGSEHGSGIDVVAGAVGACVAVLLSRLAGSEAAAGYLMSVLVTVGGAFLALLAMRRVMKVKEVPVQRPRRR
jgi:uncharacterized membrane protein YeaQ/YmgE (transglycosylase-associated protein family)